ncbi:DUF72 domain-containing protein [Marinomonas ostreistagni]|uniref:DUF72 domain-containing protein n=1 Tax=Marinomonas ostreistagni TaxID=359209 RepID=UPI001951B721|nr:DUF72 domain-containing protein [Marinomonas ostreistagni]MBM6552156.1 DUF72 domain-containing protein [Marinomonas ostreistagni]
MSKIRFGMAQWQHPAWVDYLYPRSEATGLRLGHYAKFFSSVEVGSTFYTDVAPEQIERWAVQVPDSFRFCFKVPRAVAHQFNELSEAECLQAWRAFQSLLKPIESLLGPTMLQFPATVEPRHLPLIAKLCESWSLSSALGVEVRNVGFFDKGDQEAALLRLLADTQCNKVVMDSRPVFSTQAYCESLVDAQQKKPRVPCHAIATAEHPVVRFIGHPELERNHVWLDQWGHKLSQWLQEGREPTVFVHSSDNIAAPTLASWLDQKLQQALPDYVAQVQLPVQHEQMGLL